MDLVAQLLDLINFLKKMVVIFEDNLKTIDPLLLLDLKAYQNVEDVVLSIVAGGSSDEAVNFAMILADKLLAIEGNLPKELSTKYLRLLKILKLLSLRTLDEKQQEVFFKEQILDTFKTDIIDAKEWVEKIFISYFDGGDQNENLRALYLKAIEKNQEILGLDNIKVIINGEEKLVNPTIQNWLFDYNSSSHVSKDLNRRGGYEQVNFVTGSLNARKLDKENRDLLLKIVQFYDWLRFDPLQYDFRLPGQTVSNEEYINIESPQSLIPDDLIVSVEKLRDNRKGNGNIERVKRSFEKEKFVSSELNQESYVEIKASPPIIPAPKNQPIQKPIQEIVKIVPSPEILAKPVVKPVNIEEILKKKQAEENPTSSGLRMWNSNPPEMPKKPTVDIDKKLEDLKKKVQK